jgi:hypothetical protein
LSPEAAASASPPADKPPEIGLKQALAAHLTSNHYPPLPTELVPACIKAIRNCEDGLENRPVRLPKGFKLGHKPHGVINHNTNQPPSWRLAEACHLDAFIQEED